MIDKDKLDNFEEAFSSHSAGARRTCNCGRVFIDNYNGGWDWAEGELEMLLADDSVTKLNHSAGSVDIDGVEFSMDCDCWHAKAEKIVNWLDENAVAVASYLNLERKRKMYVASQAPEVEQYQ